MEESLKIKPGRTTPRVRSATPKSGRTALKEITTSRLAKLRFLRQCLEEHSARSLLRKYSSHLTPKTVSRKMTSSFAGLDQQRMMTFIYGSLAGQTIGSEKMKHSLSEQALAKSTTRTPVYKTQEEYYDEVLALKKKIKELTADNSMLKLKVRRLEEDFQKKEKEVEQLLDPSKNNEVRRALADGKADSGTVLHSLKQKNLKLEQQLREKESAYSKLQSDLKTTKIEEMKVQLETFYNELLRLKTERAAQSNQTSRDGIAPKEGSARVKELTTTILKMSVEKTRLVAENKSLKEDLQKCLETKPQNQSKNSLAANEKTLTQEKIMSALAKLEQKFEKFETVDAAKSKGSDGSIVEAGVSAVATAEEAGKLRQREAELKDEVEKQSSLIANLKEDRAYYIEKCQEKDSEIALLKNEVDELRSAKSFSSGHRRDSTSGTSHLPSDPVEEREIPRPKERLSRGKSLTLSTAIDTGKEILEKVRQFKQNRAAKVIQKNWAQHKVKEIFKDEAAELIQETWKGHKARQEISSRLKEKEQEEREEEKERKEEMEKKKEEKIREKMLKEKEESFERTIETGHKETEEKKEEKVRNGEEKLQKSKEEKLEKEENKEENERHDASYDDAIEVIQATVMAHMYRSQQIKTHTSNSQTSQPPLDKSSAAESSSVQKTVSSQSTAAAALPSEDEEIAEEIDEDIAENVSDDEDENIVKPMIIK